MLSIVFELLVGLSKMTQNLTHTKIDLAEVSIPKSYQATTDCSFGLMASNSASSAAAMAAFKALGKKKEEDVSRYNKIPSNKQNTYLHHSEMSKMYQSPNENRSLPSVPRIQTRNIVKPGNPLSTPGTTTPKTTTPISATKTTPKKSTPGAGSPRVQTPRASSPDLSHLELSNQVLQNKIYKSPTFPADKSPYGKSPTNLSVPSLDMIKNVKQSIESKSVPKTTKRLSANYEPQEMIKNIKSSMNFKIRSAVTQPNLDTSDKSKSMLNQIRHSIDLKRISTPVMRSDDESAYTVPPDSELLKSPMLYGDVSSDDITSDLDNPKFFNLNKSYSSIGSNPLDSDYVDSTVNTPTIIIHRELPLVDESRLSRDISPIPIPPSTNAYARVPSNSVDSLPHGLSKVSLDNPTEERTKPRRKPPPSDVSSDFSSGKSVDLNEQTLVLGGYDTDFEDMKSSVSSNISPALTQFKRFPDVKVRHSHRPERIGTSLFKLGNNSKQKEIYTVDPLDLEPDSDNEVQSDLAMSNEYNAANALITHQNQPVRLKKTMRKDTRKTRKKLFNEYKPWKNHSDLNYLTEQERKRYEGLFVSNKGNYLELVVRKLVGVDYDNMEVDNDEADDSMRAAKLLANTLETRTNIHGLKSAQVDQLIHGAVVKCIWKRSRLPNETLQSIWNLVDFRKDGTLNKPEFLVGMWLIDQCLYGRKLPKKIDDIVWENLGNIGVNVVIKKKGRR